MKKLLICLLCASPVAVLYAQDSSEKYLPEIKAGTQFEFNFSGKAGDDLNVAGEILSTDHGGLSLVDSIPFKGKIQLVRTVITKKGMESGSRMKTPNEQPTSKSDGSLLYVLSDDKTDHCFSRQFIRTLKERKSASYGGITYALTDPPPGQAVLLDGRELDAIYIVSTNGRKKFWILNDPLYPFILKSASENINVRLVRISNP